jgi:hypothetical protein
VSVRTGENLDKVLAIIDTKLQGQRLIVKPRKPQSPR